MCVSWRVKGATLSIDYDPSEFRDARGFDALERLSNAKGEMTMVFGNLGRDLEDMMFWAVLANDPLICCYDKLDKEIRDGFPPVEEQRPLATYLCKMERVCVTFWRNPEAVKKALQRL